MNFALTGVLAVEYFTYLRSGISSSESIHQGIPVLPSFLIREATFVLRRRCWGQHAVELARFWVKVRGDDEAQIRVGKHALLDKVVDD